MRRLFWLLSAALVCLASPSWAAWHSCGDPLNLTPTLSPRAGAAVGCYAFTATGASGFLNVNTCATFSVSLFTDTSGSTGTAQAQIYSCPAASTNGCEKVLGDTDGDALPNDVTLNGDPTALRFGLSDIAPQYIYADITAASTSYGSVQVVCKP